MCLEQQALKTFQYKNRFLQKNGFAEAFVAGKKECDYHKKIKISQYVVKSLARHKCGTQAFISCKCVGVAHESWQRPGGRIILQICTLCLSALIHTNVVHSNATSPTHAYTSRTCVCAPPDVILFCGYGRPYGPGIHRRYVEGEKNGS